jgi:tetratricopeptide (TPR) repeat protein
MEPLAMMPDDGNDAVISVESLDGQLDQLDHLYLLDAPAVQAESCTREQLLERAAVLAEFDEHQLCAGMLEDRAMQEWRGLIDECVRLDRGPGQHVYQLPLGLRRKTLARLATRERMLAVRDGLPWSRDDRTERMFDTVLHDAPIDLARLSRDELASLVLVCEWVRGILAGLPDDAAMRARLAFEKTLSPLRQLVGTHFVGRHAELAYLEDYVGILPVDSVTRKGQRALRSALRTLKSRPPLMVYGPGGVGKSSLLAQFILTHLEHDPTSTLAFVHLDLDRALVDPHDTLTLLAEAARQLGAQFPSQGPELKRAARQLVDLQAGSDPLESSKAEFSDDEATRLFGEAVTHLLGAGRPLLWVMDTFEEAQKLGDSVVRTLWQFVDKLQDVLPGLRLVVSGRVLPSGYAWDPLPLTDFDVESALSYLRYRFAQAHLDPMPNDAQLKDILSAVGRSPLALRMAVRVVQVAGADAFKPQPFYNAVLSKIRAEQIQAQLFHRILEHIDGGEDIRRIASRGLAVRRITPDVILKVLARPCGLSVRTQQEAAVLFDGMKNQVDIFEQDFSDNSLRHRSDVRRLMLRDLKDVAHTKMREIDYRAVRYYLTQDTDAGRAEEIYHRLRLGEPDAVIAPRWRHGVERYLHGAIDEIDLPQQIFLANRLGISLPAAKLVEARQAEWEIQARHRVEDYLASGDAAAALEVLQERRARLPGSPLWRQHAEALRLAHRNDDAAKIARRGLDALQTQGDLAGSAEMLLLLALIHEDQEEFAAAYRLLDDAIDFFRRTDNPLGEVRARTAKLRLDRKTGKHHDGDAYQINAIRELLTPAVLKELGKRKTAYRELVAEIGDLDQDMLKRGVSFLGIDVATERHLELLERAIDAILDEEPGSTLRNRWGLQGNVRQWIERHSSAEIGKAVAIALDAHPYSRKVLKMVALVLKEGVDRTIKRVHRSLL